MMQANDLTAPLTDAEIEELDKFLLALGHDDAMLDISEFDGFITAVAPSNRSLPCLSRRW